MARAPFSQGSIQSWPHGKKCGTPNTFPPNYKIVLILYFPTSLRYLENEHFKNCPDETFAHGLGSLPLGAVIHDHDQFDLNLPAIQRLPTGEMLHGRTTYQNLMRYYTTLEITPEDLRGRAVSRRDDLFRQVRQIES